MCQSPLRYFRNVLRILAFPDGPSERDPLIPAPAPSSVSGYDKNVMPMTSSSSGDNYRIGIGLDVLSLLK
jgi:hypothetical protein